MKKKGNDGAVYIGEPCDENKVGEILSWSIDTRPWWQRMIARLDEATWELRLIIVLIGMMTVLAIVSSVVIVGLSMAASYLLGIN